MVKQEGDDAVEQAVNLPMVDLTTIDYLIPGYGTWGRLIAYTWADLASTTWAGCGTL